MTFCVIHYQNVTPASEQLATTTNNRRLRTQLGKIRAAAAAGAAGAGAAAVKI